MPQKVDKDVHVDDPFYDVEGCAKFLGRNERWVRQHAQEGDLPFTRMGKRLAFRKSQLQAWVDANTFTPDEGE